MLLFVFLLLQPILCIYHDINTQTYNRKEVVAKNTFWRDEIGRRREASFTIDEEGVEMEEVPLLHYLRLAGIVLIVAQFSFLLYFTARTFNEETDAMRQQEYFQLIDTPRFGKNMKKEYTKKMEKQKREKEEQAKIATEMVKMKPEERKEEVPKKAEEPKKPISIVRPKKVKEEVKKRTQKSNILKEPKPEVVVEDVETAVERKGEEKKVSPPKKKISTNAEQSQRYPRAKKGHQTKFLEEMEEFLIGDEARELEKSQVSDQMRADSEEKGSKMERDSKMDKGSKMDRGSKMEKESKMEKIPKERKSQMEREKVETKSNVEDRNESNR